MLPNVFYLGKNVANDAGFSNYRIIKMMNDEFVKYINSW